MLTGMQFESSDEASKAEDAEEYLSGLTISEKAFFYKRMMYYSQSEGEEQAQVPSADMSADAGVDAGAGSGMGAMLTDESSMAAALDNWLAGDPDQEVLMKVYEEYIAGSTYEDNLKTFGKVSYDAPSSISIDTDNFENKDFIAA